MAQNATVLLCTDVYKLGRTSFPKRRVYEAEMEGGNQENRSSNEATVDARGPGRGVQDALLAFRLHGNTNG